VKPHRLPAWFRVLRPRQWTKNLAVFAPLLFARAVFVPELALREFLAFVAFCFLSSGTYVFNDWIDREQDRHHPQKALRPIAAREIRARTVLLLIIVCWGAGLNLGLELGWGFAALGGAYLVLQIAYTAVLKHHVVLDVLCIAAGFVLRVLAGAVAISVPVSGWLFLCAMLLALFLALAKRRQELVSLEEGATQHRASLGEYSLPLLDQMLSTVAGMCILAYGLYTVAPVPDPTARRLKLRPYCAKTPTFEGEGRYVDRMPDFTPHRADDLPAYLVIVIVGHIVVPTILWIETDYSPSVPLQLSIYLPLTLVLSLVLLQPVKGAVVAIQWALRMHGFDEQNPTE